MFFPKLQPRPEQEDSFDPRDLPGKLAAASQASRVVKSAALSVLVAERSEQVRVSIATMLKNQGYDVTVARDAADAGVRLAQRPFDIMLCDSTVTGIRAAQGNDGTQPHSDMIVILISRSETARKTREAIEVEANDSITLPCNQGELAVIVQRNITRRALQRKHAQRFRSALETSNESVLDALLTALSMRDTEPPGHTERAAAYTMELADSLCIPPVQLYHIERGALLHDIGKIGIPDRVLHKPSALTPEEWIEMRKHPVVGYQMCGQIEMLKQAAQVVLRHHEKWDGTGYPDGLAAEAIPIGARIFAVADALDAMTSDRPYRKAFPFAAARQEIVKGAGRQFDPSIVRVFLNVPEARWKFIRDNAAR